VLCVEARGFGKYSAGFPFREKAAERKKELGVDGRSFGIQGGNARRSYNDVAFMRFGGKLFQKGGFASTGLPGDEEVTVCTVDEVLSHFELRCSLYTHKQK
jgi:hypothetical protein